MRNQLSTLALMLLAGCAIAGCSKSDSATPPPASREQHVGETITYLRAGTVACGEAISFASVQALEQMRAINPNVPLPPDCTTFGAEVVVNILRQYQFPGVGNIAQVGNSGGTAFVRTKDIDTLGVNR